MLDQAPTSGATDTGQIAAAERIMSRAHPKSQDGIRHCQEHQIKGAGRRACGVSPLPSAFPDEASSLCGKEPDVELEVMGPSWSCCFLVPDHSERSMA